MDNSIIMTRIAELEANLRAGEEELRLLDAKRSQLHTHLIRIGGAIAVLKDIAAEQGIPDPD